MSAPLARLALRRALPPGVALAGLAAALLAARAAWQPDAGVAAALGGEADPGALARAGVWTALAALYGLALCAAAAALPARWRAGEVQWLGRGTRGPLARALSLWLGLCAAAALALGALALAGEVAARAAPARAARELVARFAAPRAPLAPRGAPLRVAFDPGATRSGDRLRVRLRFLGGGAAARLGAHVEGAPPRGEALLGTSGALELELEPGRGERVLVLEHLDGDAALVVAAAGVEVVRPLDGPRAPALRAAARLGLALAAWLALALGLGAWMGPALAWGLTLSAALAVGWSEAAWARALPGAGLSEALARMGEGLAGPWPGARELAWAALTVAVGLGLAARGIVGWRSSAR